VTKRSGWCKRAVVERQAKAYSLSKGKNTPTRTVLTLQDSHSSLFNSSSPHCSHICSHICSKTHAPNRWALGTCSGRCVMPTPRVSCKNGLCPKRRSRTCLLQPSFRVMAYAAQLTRERSRHGVLESCHLATNEFEKSCSRQGAIELALVCGGPCVRAAEVLQSA
jgi:hypothetical protein